MHRDPAAHFWLAAIGIGLGVAIAGGGTLYAVGYHFFGWLAISGGLAVAIFSAGALADLALEHRAPIDLTPLLEKVRKTHGGKEKNAAVPPDPLRQRAATLPGRVESDGLDWILDSWKRWPNGEKQMQLRGVCRQHELAVMHEDIRGNVGRPSEFSQLPLGGYFCPGASVGEKHEMRLTESKSWGDALSLARVRMQRELDERRSG